MGTRANKNDSTAAVEMLELDADYDGNAYLEGQRPKVPKALWEALTAYQDDKAIHAKATQDLKESKDELTAAAKKFREFFEPTENDENILIWQAGGLECEIDRDITEKIKTRTAPAPPPITAGEQAKQEIEQLKKAGTKKKSATSPTEIY